MSWSFSRSGTPDEIVKALDEESGKLSDQSKIEYDDALPHLKGLVRQNFRNENEATPPNLSLSAWGSGSSQGGKQLRRECAVALKALSLIAVALFFSSLGYCQEVTKPIQAPVKEVQVQKPSSVQKAVQAPVQAPAVQKGVHSQAAFEGDRFLSRRRERVSSRREARVEGACSSSSCI